LSAAEKEANMNKSLMFPPGGSEFLLQFSVESGREKKNKDSLHRIDSACFESGIVGRRR
jgi:hypothetical protein